MYEIRRGSQPVARVNCDGSITFFAAGQALVLLHYGTPLSWGALSPPGGAGGSSESRKRNGQGPVGLNYEEIKRSEYV